MKIRKLSSKRYINNVEKEYDERNWKDMSDYNDSDEWYQIGENDEEIDTDDTEVLKLGKLIP